MADIDVIVECLRVECGVSLWPSLPMNDIGVSYAPFLLDDCFSVYYCFHGPLCHVHFMPDKLVVIADSRYFRFGFEDIDAAIMVIKDLVSINNSRVSEVDRALFERFSAFRFVRHGSCYYYVDDGGMKHLVFNSWHLFDFPVKARFARASKAFEAMMIRFCC